MRNQKGFTLVEGLLIVLIMCVVGFAGYYAWTQNQDDEVEQTETAQQETTNKQNMEEESKPSNDNAQTIPDGWKTVSENGLTVSYPATWDNTEEDYQRLSVIGMIEGDIAYVGFGAPLGYKHLGGDNWEYVYSDGSPAEGSGPTIADINVEGAISTIIADSGDGGCGGSRIIFATDSSLYAVALPWECDLAAHGSAGIDSELVAQDLNKVIRLISIN